MSNEGLQPSQESTEKPLRKSRIRKGLHRTLNTEKYQTLVIIDEIEEEIEWRTIEERDKKIRNWETLLLREFKQSHDRILSELNLVHKKAYFVDGTEKDPRPEPGEQYELDTLS